MDQRHKELLGKGGTDDADARGEHSYPETPDVKKKREGAIQDQLEARDRHYAAGADGTEAVTEPED